MSDAAQQHALRRIAADDQICAAIRDARTPQEISAILWEVECGKWRPSDPRCDAGRDVEPAGARHGIPHGPGGGRPFPGLTWQQSLVWCFAIWALYLLWSA